MVSSGWLNWLHVALQGLWRWPLAAALFPALLGLWTLIPQELQTLFRGTLLLSIAVVTLYGQQRSQVEQQREQRLQLLAFANRAADLFRAEGDRRAEEEQQRALQAALAVEESERRQEQ